MDNHLSKLYKVTYYLIDLFEKELLKLYGDNFNVSSNKYIIDVLTKLVNIMSHLQKLEQNDTEKLVTSIKEDDYDIIQRFIDKYDNKPR